MKSILLTALTFASLSAFAASPIKIENARIFLPMKGSNATAGYGKITNSSGKEVTFGFSKAEGFKAVELHESLEKDGRMAMQKIDALPIPAKGSAELKPGGHHLMLFDAAGEMKAGSSVNVTILVDGKPSVVPFKLAPREAKPSEEHHHHH